MNARLRNTGSSHLWPSRYGVRRCRQALAVACGVGLLAVASGCSPTTNNSADAPTSSTAVPTSTPSPVASSLAAPLAARDAAIAAYRGMWAAYQKAALTANPDDPALTTYAAEGALETLTSGLRSIRDRGLVGKGEILLSPRVTALEPIERPTTIEITDCADTTDSLLYRTSGELYDDTPGGRRLIIATVKDPGGGTWKVVSFGARAIGTC